MKKLLSLALVLTMLFTIIAVPSVSAATKEIVLVEADLANSASYAKIVGKGTDAHKSLTSAKASRGASTYTYNSVSYKNTVDASLTTSTAESAAHPGVATVGNDVPLIKMTQTAIASIYRIFFADGDLSIQAGDKLSISFKFYADDPYTTPATATGPGTKSAEPVSFQWNFGYLNASSGGQGTGVSTKTYTTGQWYDINLSYDITASNIATYKKVYGVISRGTPNLTTTAGVTSPYSGTMYITAPVVKVTREVRESNIVVSKLGEGTVEGGGIIAAGSAATLKATPAEGYHFAGWYEKTGANVKSTCFSKDAVYTFTPSSNMNIIAAFEKDEVNSWVELLNIPFDGNVSPSEGINFWGKTDDGTNVNNVNKYVTYEDEELTDVPFDGGENLLKFDKSVPGNINNVETYSTYGMSQGRINNIPGYYTRFETGKKYKMSMWIYIAATEKEKQKGDKISFGLSYYMNNTANAVMRTATATVGEWSLVEAVIDSMPSDYANASTGFRIIFADSISKLDDENADMPTVAYFDNLKYEKFDGLDVTATAENGVVYGTGEYLKGDKATLVAAGNAGYVFDGYYVGDECVSTNAKYTFIVEDDITVEAKFVKRAEATFPENNLYHWGAETGELGTSGSWYKWVGQIDNNDNKTDGAGVITWAQAAELGVAVPSADPTFGDNLYADNFVNSAKPITATVDGRMRGWENGKFVNNAAVTEKTEASGRYIEGKQYKFTWWVYPKSMRVVDDTDTYVKKNQTRLTITHNDGKDTGISTTETLNVGEWNKIEWVFTANAKSALYAPGIYYKWVSSGTADSEGKKNIVNCAFYDNIQVEEIVEWNWSDTKAPSAGYFRYLDGNEFVGGTGATNRSAFFVEDYTKHDIPEAPGNAGSKVFVFDYKRPELIDDVVIPEGSNEKDPTNDFEPKEGSAYYGKTYAEAYEYLTRLDNAGAQIGARFTEIAPKGVLHIGKHYKISCMVYIPEKKNISTGETVNTDTSVRIIGVDPDAKTASGGADNNRALGDGKDLIVDVPVGKWTEVGYIFKATEAGASIRPSIKIELHGIGVDGKVDDQDVMIEKWYIDDVKIENVHVDDLALVIDGSSETEVVATATVNDIKEGNTLDAIVIIAAYDANGKLVSVALSNNGASKPLAINDTLTATYTKADGITDYVAFLWDDLTDIRPYVKPVPLTK